MALLARSASLLAKLHAALRLRHGVTSGLPREALPRLLALGPPLRDDSTTDAALCRRFGPASAALAVSVGDGGGDADDADADDADADGSDGVREAGAAAHEDGEDLGEAVDADDRPADASPAAFFFDVAPACAGPHAREATAAAASAGAATAASFRALVDGTAFEETAGAPAGSATGGSAMDPRVAAGGDSGEEEEEEEEDDDDDDECDGGTIGFFDEEEDGEDDSEDDSEGGILDPEEARRPQLEPPSCRTLLTPHRALSTPPLVAGACHALRDPAHCCIARRGARGQGPEAGARLV